MNRRNWLLSIITLFLSPIGFRLNKPKSPKVMAMWNPKLNLYQTVQSVELKRKDWVVVYFDS